MTQPLMFKLDQTVKGRGLRCDRDGLFFAGEALLERDAEDQFRPIPATTIRKVFSNAYRADSNWESRIRSVDVVAKALNNGDVARAMMAAVLMRLPEPDSGIHIADIDGFLAKAGFDPAEPRDERGWWTTGSAGGHSTGVQQAFLEEPLFEPLLEQLLGRPPVEPEPMPPPIDVVPPTMGPRNDRYAPPLTNPYPDSPECEQEWDRAQKFCDELRRRGKFGKNGYKGFGWWFNQCLRGQVSQNCGGNIVVASLSN
jgi:hypothetical protein